MDLAKYLTVLVLFFFDGGETGGHGEKHHTHVKVHIPEFIHHDHHKKVITIHHHHHKPKKEHHHHHHHHHKPHIPHGHHYHHTHKKTHTILKGTDTKKHHGHHHGHHGYHGHHGHRGHHGHHGHHGHGHHHYDVPSYSYEPSSLASFEDDYASNSPSVPSYTPVFIQSPRVHGIQHTVKQVKVFDSLPGGLPSPGQSHGYKVTEDGDEDEGEDSFTPLNGIQQAYPGTYGFISGVSADPVTAPDPFAPLIPQNTAQSHYNDPFAASPLPTSGLSDVETFSANAQNNPFASSGPTQSAQSTPNIPLSFHSDSGGFDNPANSFVGDSEGTNLLSSDDKSEDNPVSFQREAGVQQTITTGGVETLTY